MSSVEPRAYISTEVGLIPSDWTVRQLLEVMHIANGQVDPTRPPYNTMVLVAPDHIESGTGKLLAKQTATEQKAISGKYLFATGDVVYSKIRPYLRKAFLADFSGLCSADMYPLTPASGVVPEFILPLLLGHRFSTYAETVSARSGMPKINREELAGFSVALPPLDEQKRIGSIFSDIDALITGLDKLIAKKRNLQQAAMQQLLTGQRRLPGFSGEWEVKRLGDLSDMGSGGTPHTGIPEYFGGHIPWVSIGDMTKGGKFLLSTDKNLTELGLSNCAAQVFQPGTVLYAMYASIGECSIAGWPMTTSQAILGIRPKGILSSEFLYYHLLSIKGSVKNMGQQGTQANLNAGMVRAFEIRLPRITEQTAIAAVLSDMDAELATLEARRDKTHQLKQGMMQALLTGRIRLV